MTDKDLPFYRIGYGNKFSFAADEEKKYKELRKQYGPKWRYWDYEKDPIVTIENELGYRSSTVYPTDNYFLHLGCSNTYGSYLHEHHRASNLIAEYTRTPVINLGIPGGGGNIIHMNVQKLMTSKYPKPKAIFVQWPKVYRMTFPAFHGKRKIIRANQKVQDEQRLFESLLRYDGTFEILAQHSYDGVNNFNIPVINYAVDPETASFYKKIYNDKIHEVVRIDKARDDMHCGIETNKIIADYILGQLNV